MSTFRVATSGRSPISIFVFRGSLSSFDAIMTSVGVSAKAGEAQSLHRNYSPPINKSEKSSFSNRTPRSAVENLFPCRVARTTSFVAK